MSTNDDATGTVADRPMSGRTRTSHDELNQRLYEARRDLQAHKARHKQLRAELTAAQNEVAVLRKALASTSFRIGTLITHAMRSPGALLRLPVDLWRLRAARRADAKRRPR